MNRAISHEEVATANTSPLRVWCAVAAIAGLALAVVNFIAGQSFVEACPFIDPPPLACDVSARGAFLAVGVGSAIGMLTIFAWLGAMKNRPPLAARWLLTAGGLVMATVSVACAVASATSQRL